ncbi:MAG: response regulator [Nannocystaceae bacterium]
MTSAPAPWRNAATSAEACDRRRRPRHRAPRRPLDCLTVLAHELRTPLHAVVGMSQLLAGEEVPARLQPMISTVRDGAELLASAVDTVLEYSENKEGLTLQATEFDVGELVDRVVRLVRVDLDARELGLTATVDLARPIVCADRERLQQILLNLVASAVKFTAAGSVSIALRGGAAPAELEGRVRCVGWTIPRHLLPELFEPFHELPTLRRERLANTGLGLAICKQLCAAMGGTIRAESGPEGTVFVFTVVAPPVEGRAVRPAEEALAPFDVLVVDDSPVNRAVAEAMLGRLGFTCTLASSGAEARERYRERAYDLVLMDVNMPEEDGPSVARALLAGPGPHAAFVALTADTAGRARQLCEDAGIRCLVTKPLRLERLEALLRRVVPRTAEASARIDPASAVESGGERP